MALMLMLTDDAFRFACSLVRDRETALLWLHSVVIDRLARRRPKLRLSSLPRALKEADCCRVPMRR
jgi:hypothetical protein